MRILRRINQLTIILAAYLLALAAYVIPFGWTGAALVLCGMFFKKAQRYSAYGTARWADITDVRHMLDGPGLILGRISGRPSRIDGLKALFSKRPAKDAVMAF